MSMTDSRAKYDAPAWSLSKIGRADELDPAERAVELILQLRHDYRDHEVAVMLLQGIRPSLTGEAIEEWIDNLLEHADQVRSAEVFNQPRRYEVAVGDYEVALRLFAQGDRL